MKKTSTLWAKALLALAAIGLVVVVAARELAPLTPASLVLAYVLGGTAILVVVVLVTMWLKFAVNQFLLNAGATDTQWLWFKSDPKGLEALRSRGDSRQSNDET